MRARGSIARVAGRPICDVDHRRKAILRDAHSRKSTRWQCGHLPQKEVRHDNRFYQLTTKAVREFSFGASGSSLPSILVATDYSPASATAVKLAARLAKEFHARLYVLHAVEPDAMLPTWQGRFPNSGW